MIQLLQMLAQSLPNPFADYAHQGSSLWNQLDFGSLSSGSAAVVLGAVWYFARIIRKVVGVLFMVCVVYLTLRFACGVDLMELVREQPSRAAVVPAQQEYIGGAPAVQPVAVPVTGPAAHPSAYPVVVPVTRPVEAPTPAACSGAARITPYAAGH